MNYDSSGYSRDEFRGYNLTYNSDGIPTGGVVTSYAAYVYGQRIVVVDGVQIAVTALVATATTYSNSDDLALFKAALSGSDQIRGGSGNDKMNGGAWADYLAGRGGNDPTTWTISMTG